MFARSKVALTFLCLVVALGLATESEANSFVHNPRDHVQVNRMIKKRAANDFFSEFLGGGAIGAAADPTASISTESATGTLTTSPTISNSATVSVSASRTDTLSLSGTASVTNTDTTASNTATESSTSATTSDTTSTSASSSTTSTQSSTTATQSNTPSQADPQPTPAPQTSDDTQPTSTSKHTFTQFVTATDDSATSTDAPASTVGAAADNNKITKTTLTVIVVIAASIGLIALAWTLFRKWKLRPSSNFDDRMQPIDWQPTGPEDTGIPTHRRAGSTASHGSFHSSGHGDSYGHGSNQRLDTLPEHDFTAGPATLAPVGGYADLQRGPSPQPMAELARGPSLTRPQYGATYDYNNTGMRY